MKRFGRRLAATTAALVLAGMYGCPGPGKPGPGPSGGPPPGPPPPVAAVLPSDAQATCTVSAAEIAGWFESGSVSKDGVVKPANSVTFPDNPNCSFYQWSEQMFLWLTSPAPVTYGGGGGRIFASPAFFEVSPPDSSGTRTFIANPAGTVKSFNLRAAQVGSLGLPVIMDVRGRMFQVEPPKRSPSGRPLILNQAGEQVEIGRAVLRDGRPVFFDRAGHEIERARPLIAAEANGPLVAQSFEIDKTRIFLDPAGNVIDVEPFQADDGVLESQGGSLVYYITMVNDVYAYFLTGTKNGGITPKPTAFPTTQVELDKVVALASAHGTTFPDPEALAVEVKSSWVEASTLTSTDGYITTMATVPTYDTTDPKKWVPNGKKTVKLALVGMHVVGSTKGHPEMIWATFEHVNNTPVEAYSYNSTSGPKSVPRATAGSWVFSQSGSSGPFNAEHMTFSDPNIVASGSFNISPSDTMRMKAWGAAANQAPNPLGSAAASNTEIISINNSVLGQIDSADVRANYIMTGSTWTIGGAAPSGPFDGSFSHNEVGTSQLANTTMETYQQGSSNGFSPGVNCFSCHVSNKTSVSHVFAPLQPLF